MEKAREFQKNIYFCFIDYAKAFDCEMSQLLLQFPNQVFIIPKIAFSFHWNDESAG